MALAAILLAGIVSCLLGITALRSCPFSGDEYSMYLQAEGFAQGVLKAKAPPYSDLVQVDHVVIDDYVRSKYPPGTAALLALGVRAGVPWLPTPLEGALALLFAWLTARLVYDERRAFLTVCFLGAAPLFIYESASFLSHAATLLFGAVGTFFVALWARNRRLWLLVPFGVCLGCLFLTRPLDALLLGLALLAFRNLGALVVSGASALPFAGLQLWYNKLQFGSIFTDGYKAYIPSFVAIYGDSGAMSNIHPLHLVSPKEVFNHLAVIETFVTEWTIPGAALIAALGFVAWRREAAQGDSKATPIGRFLGLMAILFVGMLMFTYADPDDSPRPRYLSMVLLPLSFFAAAGWDKATEFVRDQLGRRASWIVGLLLWIAPIFLIASYLERRVPEITVHATLRPELEKQHVSSGVVIVRAEWPSRYARNGMFFDHRPILLSVSKNVSAADVAARFPGEAVYEAFEPHGSNPWKHPWVIKRFTPGS